MLLHKGHIFLQERFGRHREDKLRPAEDRARDPDGLAGGAHAAGQQHRLQDQRRHSQRYQKDAQQGLPLAASFASVP